MKNINKKNFSINNSKSFQAKSESLFNNLTEGNKAIIEIQKKDIPQKTMKLFEEYSKRFILPNEYKEGNFEKYRYIKHTEPIVYTTYIVLQDKKGEKNIYIHEMDNEGNKIGHGEIRLGIQYEKKEERYFKNKPFVGFTSTEDDYKNKGYGTQRLQTMNDITQKIRGLKLYSSTTFSDENAKKIRESLVQKGKAKKYTEKDGTERFYCI